MEITEILTVIGLLITYIGSQFMIIKYFISSVADLRKTLFEEVNKIKSDYMLKEDLKSHIDRIEKTQEKLEDSVSRIHERFDKFIMEVTQIFAKKGENSS